MHIIENTKKVILRTLYLKFLRQKKWVNAELVGKLQKNSKKGNFILYGQKQSLTYVPEKKVFKKV